MRVDCPRCGRPVPGADIDLASKLAVCRPCGEVVALPAGDALALLAPAAPHGAMALSRGAMYRPIDLRWRDERGGDGGWRATVVPSRLPALFFVPFTLVWDAFVAFMGWGLLSGGVSWVALLSLAPFAAGGLLVTYAALCALLNRTTVTVTRDAFEFARRPIRQLGDVREATANIASFEAAQVTGGAPNGFAGGGYVALRWGVRVLTRDRRSIPLRFGFGDRSHAEFAAARMMEMLDDVKSGDAPYRG